jgi:hypothetical protein
MLALLTRSPKKTVSSPRNRARLGVEQLETRFCPSGLQFLSFTAAPMNSGKLVDLHGSIADSNPSSVAITFSGVAAGSTHADANGNFDLQVTAASLGAVAASGADQDGTTASRSATVSASAPSLTLNLAYGTGKQVTLSGKVTDAQPGGLVVTFTGVVGGTTTTDGNGNYSVTLTASSLGQISATTQDVWALNSAAASVTVSDVGPTITIFGSQRGNIWTFSGHVTGNFAPGSVVTFSGPADINGKTATIGSDGSYSLSVMLSSSDVGWVTASVTDIWGLAADAEFCLPVSTKPGGGG